MEEKKGKLSGAQPLGGPMETSNHHVNPTINKDNQMLFLTTLLTISYYSNKNKHLIYCCFSKKKKACFIMKFKNYWYTTSKVHCVQPHALRNLQI